MIRKTKNPEKGITLIALVVTIIVLLILAGITINMLLGDDSIIHNTGTVKESAEIRVERENLKNAVLIAIKNNKFKELKKIELVDELNKTKDTLPTVVSGNTPIYVEYTNSHRIYDVNIEGDVTYLGSREEVQDRVSITADNDSNPELLDFQQVKINVATLVDYENDQIFIHYGWSKDKKTEPAQSGYKKQNSFEGTKSSRSFLADSSTTQDEGQYYLWIKVLLNGKETKKVFGPFGIKENRYD